MISSTTCRSTTTKFFPIRFHVRPLLCARSKKRIRRYPNPEKPGELFQWDIHGRLFTPAKVSIPDTAVVMIHGGAANEYEFIFTPDGPRRHIPILSQSRSQESARRRRAAYCVLGIPVLAISLPGHYSRQTLGADPCTAAGIYHRPDPQRCRTAATAWPFTRLECAPKRSRRWSRKTYRNRSSCGATPPAANIFT